MVCGLAALVSGCGLKPEQKSVVVYTSVDQVYSEPILKSFEEQSGIRVLPIYDVEAAKTTGLVNRLIAEKDNPQADVFWNGEFVQTLLLKEQGALAPYLSPAARDLPAQYLDPDGYWSGLGGRARVIIVNTDLVAPEAYPTSIYDLLDPGLPGQQAGIANPLFGTTATQAAALYAALGPDEARDFYARLQAKNVRVVDGNSAVRDLVANGQLAMGLTDTDDACGAIQRGAPVVVVVPDQAGDQLGTLVIPNTVALVAGGPHPHEAQALIDYLLSNEVEKQLLESGWFQLSLRTVEASLPCDFGSEIRNMQVSYPDIYGQLQQAQEDLSEIFLR